ncbi:MAG: sigma factor-like helix-turn-helix DNA-binding protein [Acidimicrobiia bacterium]
MAKKDIRVQVKLSIEGDWKKQPLQAVTGITRGMENLEEYRRQAVEMARADGRSWAEIGKSLGVSRQAAWERFSTD